MLNESLFVAIKCCLQRGINFAVYAYPGEKAVHFIASTKLVHTPQSEDCFIISPFGINNPRVIVICNDISLDDVLQMEYAPEVVCPWHSEMNAYDVSTKFDDYHAAINHVVSTLKESTGKIVVSRVVAVNSEKAPLDVADEYFDAHGDCFRCIYYTTETGLWFNATPELLVDYDKHSRHISSMSLAGTRVASIEKTNWDAKNTMEHKPVVNHIVDVMTSCGLTPTIQGPYNIGFGNIEHLCHIVSAEFNGSDIQTIIERLNPTPAVCGWPVAKAYKVIRSIEHHNRYCYGGYIGIYTPKRVRMYVNLRCALVEYCKDGYYRYNLFGGGGVNAMSVAEDEWTEAANKMSTLYNIISPDMSALYYPLLDTQFDYHAITNNSNLL